MLDRRTFGKLLGATALSGLAAPAVISRSLAQGAAPAVLRGNYLIKNGAVITVDPALGVLARGDVHVSNGRIEAVGPDLTAAGAETIDATDMIVMPGFVETHHHMWSSIGRNFVGDGGFGYFPAKTATSKLYEPVDFYRSVTLGLVECANAGITTVHNWSHNTRTPAHADAELRRPSRDHAARPLLLRSCRSDAAQRAAELRRHRPREGRLFRYRVGLRRSRHLRRQSARVVAKRRADLLRGHEAGAGAQAEGLDSCRAVRAQHARRRGLRKKGWLGPDLLICHYIPASDSDAAAMARTKTPLSFSTLSEMRLSGTGDPRAALLRMRKAGVLISLSFDATSIAPLNMFETMRVTWNMGMPWKGTPSEGLPEVGFHEAIEMGTLNGAKALGIGDVTGSLTVGKRADIILIRGNDINIAPIANVETAVVQAGDAGQRRHRDGRRPYREARRQARRLRRGEDCARRQGFGAAHSHRGRRKARASNGQIAAVLAQSRGKAETALRPS